MAFFNKRYPPPGTPPGTLTEQTSTGESDLQIRLIDYNTDEITIKEHVDAATCRPYLERDSITWVHVQGLPTEAVVRELGTIFELHSLALEDVLNTGQRPKIEPFNDQLFIIMSMPIMDGALVNVKQVSCFLSKNFVVSFYDGDFAPFEPLIKRLNDSGSRLRSRGADFLLYSLVDLVVDQGFPVLEEFGLQLEKLEQLILETASSDTLENIHIVKRELILLRHMIWPQREVINQLQRNEYALIQENTMVYLRDCYDHTIQVMDLVETYRDMTSSMLDIYLSSVSARMNEIMRVLTIIATIFIPLTFIAGVYGMNFDRNSAWNMPELGWPYGYLIIWGLMISIAALMLLFFRRRGWF